MEENHHGSDSKAAEKFIQIDSIFIDLYSSDDKCDDQKCELFSIRGYVSDMRKKDWKICWPFSDLDEGHQLDKHILLLPPVYDPSFNSQRGKIHWQEKSDKAAESVIFDNSCHNPGNFSSASPKAPRQDVINGRTMVDNASNLSCQPSSCDEKENRLEVADKSNVALISQSEPGCASHEVTEIEPASGNLILRVTEESLAAKQTPPDHLNGKLTLVVSENDNTVDVDQACHIVKFQENGDASMESNESTISSSENAETIDNSPHHCHLGKLHCRRTPKIRLLAELLGENGNIKGKNVESSPSNGTPEASVQADVRYASKCQVTTDENVWHSNHKRERRLRRNGKFRHQENSSSSVDKQIQTWRGETESPVSSLGTENALSGIKRTMKGVWSSYKMDGNNNLRKKKSKKFPVVDPYAVSLMPSKAKDQCETRVITEYRSEEALDSAAILVHHDEFSSRIPHSILSNPMESKSNTSKNPSSSKEPVIFEEPTNVFPWNNGIIRKGSVTQKDVETIKSRTVPNPFQCANYKNNERDLHLSLNNYSNPLRDDKGIRRRGENELPTFVPKRDDTSTVSKLNDIKTSNLGDRNHFHQASDVFYEQGVQSVVNGKMASLRMPLPRQNPEPHTDNSWSQLQRTDIYSERNGKRTIEPQEPLASKRRQINQRVDRASDRGTSDDIPMEIVELMAKNQYERRLPDVENNKQVSETGNFSRAVQVHNYGDICRNGRGLLQKPKNLKQKTQARNVGNAANRAENVVETRKQKSVDYFSNIGEFHFNTNHLQQNRILGHNASIHSQEEPPKGIQYSSNESKRQSYTEIRKCNGTIVKSGPYNSKVQSFIEHVPVSEQNMEAAHIWSSTSLMPDHLPNGYQRFPAHSTGREKISSPRSLQMGNAKAQNYHNHHPTNLEMHGRHNNAEAYSQNFAESSLCHRPNVVELHQDLVGSLELYSNETISAMHLLSLMDAGMRSNAPMTAAGTNKSSKEPPIPRPLKGKDFPGMDICFNEAIQDINQFSSAVHNEVHISAASASASTYQHSRGFGTDTNFSSQAVFKSQNTAKMKCLDPLAWSKDQKLLKTQFRSGLGTDDRAFPDNGTQKGWVNASNSKGFVLGHQVERNSEECKLVAHTRTLQNQKSTSETEICSVNKNPADFSLPEAGNIYMIGAEDFHFGRTLHSKNRSSSIYFNDGYKRQRIV